VNSEQSPPTISVFVNKNSDGDDVSSLCSKSIDALSSVGKNICDALNKMERKIEGHQDRTFKVMEEINASLKAMAKSTQQSGLLISNNNLDSGLFGNAADVAGSHSSALSCHSPPLKSDVLVGFELNPQFGTPKRCEVLPPEHLLSMFGKVRDGIREDKSMPMDPLRVLLACAYQVFSTGEDRFVIPVLLEWESKNCSDVSDYKEKWLGECREWMGDSAIPKGGYVTAAILYLGSSPVFLIFSYDFTKRDLVQPKITVYASEKTTIPTLFPWEDLYQTFSQLICFDNLGGKMTVANPKFETVLSGDKSISLDLPISSMVSLEDNDFCINMKSESLKNYDYTLAVNALVVFATKGLRGEKALDWVNPFKSSVEKLIKGASTNDILTLRLCICEAIYEIMLGTVSTYPDRVKLLTSVDGVTLGDVADHEMIDIMGAFRFQMKLFLLRIQVSFQKSLFFET
jgi:hypothetical protein